MPRPHRRRRVEGPPAIQWFKPVGVPLRDLEEVSLGIDELEALRLADQEGLYQEAAAERMAISRATFGRLVAAARAKVAEALVEGKAIRIEGGPIEMQGQRTFECAACSHRWQESRGTGRPTGCPSCGSPQLHRAAGECGAGGGRRRRNRCRGRHGVQG